VTNKPTYLVIALLLLVVMLTIQVWVQHRHQDRLLEIVAMQNDVIADVQANLSDVSHLLQAALRDIDAISSQVTHWQEMQAHPPGGWRR